ncbi:YajQ family cyclic di-GMP-binding protein [Candidatus Saccharibacteria bacterium]|nr:YajQ family cyclic di-GMP-binding protein [Candidatus Saccharibacteria bacterium]
MPIFSFDITSDYDKAEINNVFAQVEKEIINRYDFKGTSASIEWLRDKSGFKVTGENEWQCDAILEIIRKKLAVREQSSKILDLTAKPIVRNLKYSREIPFKSGLKQDDAKKIIKQLRAELPKIKTQIQGEEIRVTSSSKNDLQKAIQLLKSNDFDFPLQFVNFR